MKSFQIPGIAGTMLWLSLFCAAGQTNPAVSTTVSSGKVVLPERITAVDANITSAVSVRPTRPALPPEVQAKIERFKIDARNYVAQQEALKKQLAGASEDERRVLRERIRILREAWLERAREIRKEYKDRLADLKEKLPDHSEVLDSVRSEIKDSLRQEQQGGRPRRGGD
jgi:GTP1/Obg family GTP-binding protein